MTYRTKALSPTEIEEHLRRADELGVSLKECASAYDVNLNTLANSKAILPERTASRKLRESEYSVSLISGVHLTPQSPAEQTANAQPKAQSPPHWPSYPVPPALRSQSAPHTAPHPNKAQSASTVSA